jgi:Putative zinc- or iron-chelating domain
MDEPPPWIERELAELHEQLRTMAAQSERAERLAVELAAALDAMVTVFQLRGELGPGHLRMLERVRRHVSVAVEPALALDRTADKYAVAGVDIDCDARMPLCHGRCCSADIALSEQDLREGKLAWRIREPYYLPKVDGYCANQDRSTGGCGAYAQRPAQCRTYDCREDARIWIDFEARIPAPLPPGLTPLRRRPTST